MEIIFLISIKIYNGIFEMLFTWAGNVFHTVIIPITIECMFRVTCIQYIAYVDELYP